MMSQLTVTKVYEVSTIFKNYSMKSSFHSSPEEATNTLNRVKEGKNVYFAHIKPHDAVTDGNKIWLATLNIHNEPLDFK